MLMHKTKQCHKGSGLQTKQDIHRLHTKSHPVEQLYPLVSVLKKIRSQKCNPIAWLNCNVGGNDGLYSSNPRRVSIYNTFTWVSRWASIHMSSIYSNTICTSPSAAGFLLLRSSSPCCSLVPSPFH